MRCAARRRDPLTMTIRVPSTNLSAATDRAPTTRSGVTTVCSDSRASDSGMRKTVTVAGVSWLPGGRAPDRLSGTSDVRRTGGCAITHGTSKCQDHHLTETDSSSLACSAAHPGLGQDSRHGGQGTLACRLSVPGRNQVMYLRAADRLSNAPMASHSRDRRRCVR